MNLSNYIDHTILKADASKKQIKTLCEEAIQYNFKAVCLNPTHVELASELLQDSSVEICTVIGFPLGANTSAVKAFETKDAIKNGATEVDMVINIGALKDGNTDLVYKDIKAVVDASEKTLVKVIIETALLNDIEKKIACELSLKAGADYVKTSTGFSSSGAKLEDIEIMKSVVKENAKVKASGGIKDKEFATQLIDAGASRLGTSSGIILSK